MVVRQGLVVLLLAMGGLGARAETIGSMEVEFHPLVRSWLTILDSAEAPVVLTRKVTSCLNEQEQQNLATVRGCGTQLQTANLLCRRFHDPIGEMLSLPVKERYEYQTDNIEALVDMVGSLFAYTGVKGARESWIQPTETIITKIRFETYSQQLRGSQRDLASLNCTLSSEQREYVARLSLGLDEAARVMRVLSEGPRMDLPYPLLSAEERRLTSMVLGAMLWRVRGGGGYNDHNPRFSLPQFERRKFLRDPVSAIADLNGGSSTRFIGSSIMVQFFFQGYSQFFDMGHMPGHKEDCGTQVEDFENMSKRGVYFVENAAEDLARQGYDTRPLEFAGRQIGACYLHAWEVMTAQRRQWSPAVLPPEAFDPGGIASGPLTWGELCFGAGLGVALAETLQPGRVLNPHSLALDSRTTEHRCR